MASHSPTITANARELLSTIRRVLQIEPEWVSPFDNGFEWWPGPFAQRMWIDANQQDRLHIETKFLRNLAADERTLLLVAEGNRFVTFSSLVLSPENRSLQYHASIRLGGYTNEAALRLALLTAGMQAADADAKAKLATQFFKGEPDVTSHPTSGLRELGHVALRTLEAGRTMNDEAGSLAGLDFKPLEELRPCPWITSVAGQGAFAAEFAFTGSDPTALLVAKGDSGAPNTALLRLTTDFEHPQFKHGVLARLKLPMRGNAELANTLNRAEAFGPLVSNADQLGAWCRAEGDEIVFATFIPTLAFSKELLMGLIYGSANRALSAKEFLFPTDRSNA